MATSIHSARVALSQVGGGKGKGSERGSQDDRQVRIRCAGGAELSDAELELVAAAGGGIRVGSDGANN
jgi:hypothetical protein